MNSVQLIKVTCIVNKSISVVIYNALKELHLPFVLVQSARTSVLKEKHFIFDYRTATKVEEHLVDIYRFYIPEQYEYAVLSLLANEADLSIPGRGSIYSEDVELIGMRQCTFDEDRLKKLSVPKPHLLSGIMGICCIVQRGQGTSLEKAILDKAISVPVITYGIGMGLRNKLGLLRITIPVDKEVLSLTVHKQDALAAMNLIIDVARLHHPGKGFIYMYPIRHGIIDTKLYHGKARHVASMEQIIAAIDDMKGNTDWRRKTASVARHGEHRRYLTDLINYTIICNEGKTEDIIKAAMNAGAGGATLSNLRCSRFKEEDLSLSSHAKEMSDLIIASKLREPVFAEMEKSGLFAEDTDGIIEISSVDRASTYFGSQKK